MNAKSSVFLILALLLLSLSAKSQSFDTTGLALWFSADSVNKTNNFVDTWYDHSSNNSDGVQLVAGQQPLFIDSLIQLNNHPVIRFDGNDFLSLGDKLDLLNKNWSYFIISKQANVGIQTVFAKNDFSGTAGHYAMVNLAPSYGLLYRNAASNQYSTATTIPSNYFLTEVFLDRSVAKNDLYVNNTLINSLAFGADNATSWDNALPFNIGSNSANSFFFNGDIAEVLIFSRTLTAIEKIQVQNYLRNKYAPPVNLSPDIAILYGFCDTMIHAGTGFTRYNWNTGNNADTLEYLTVKKSGKYTVTVTDIFGFTSSDTIQINYPNTQLTISDSTICAGNTINVATSLVGQPGYSYLWADGSTNTSYTANQASVIYVTVTDSLLCSQKSDTAIVTIDDFANHIDIGDTINICSGNSIALINPPLPPSSLTYVWSDNSTNTSLVANATGTYWVSVTNPLGCVGKDTVYVNILGAAPTVDFVADTACLGSITTFINNSSTSYDSLKWNFGDGAVNTTNFNASHLYTSFGSFVVTLTEYQSVCYNTVSKTILVKPVPLADFSYASSCSGFPVLFTNGSNAQTSGTIVANYWNFDGVGNGYSQDTSFIFTTAGAHTISLAVESSNGCVDTVSKTITTVTTAVLPVVSLLSPSNNLSISNSTISFSWSVSNSIQNTIQLASDSLFNSIFYQSSLSQNQINISPTLTNNQIVFWRIIASNYCNEKYTSAVHKFTYFNPAAISGISLWLSSDSVNQTNNYVDTWIDRSGNSINGIQLNAGQQPIVIDSLIQLNNYPALHFDGNDYLSLGDNLDLLNKSWSYFIISKQANTTTQTVFAKNDYSGTAGHYALAHFPPNYGLLYRNVSVSSFPSAQIIPNTYFLTEAFLDRHIGNAELYVNNHLVNSALFAPDTMSIWDNTLPFNIGANSSGSFFLTGDIAEVLIFNKKLNYQEETQVKAYLRNKYAPPVNLLPDITVGYGFCDTIIHAGLRFKNYLWNTGNSADTLESLSVNKSGTYVVTATDIFGYTSTDSITITFPSISNPVGNSVLCSGSTKLWNSGLPTNSYTFQWQDNSTDSLITIAAPGNYWVKVTDTAGCFHYSDTITYSTDNFPQIASLGNNLNLCAGNSIFLTAGAGTGLTYLWSNNSSNDSLIVTTSGLYWLTVTNINGCIKHDTIGVTIVGVAPTANFSSTNTCITNATSFTDLSSPPSGNTIFSWQWNFGELASGINNTSFLQNPMHTYVDTGSYTVKLIVTTDVGCTEAFSKIIKVYPNPLAGFTSSNLCNNSGVIFSDTSHNYNHPINQWAWNFGDALSGTANTSSLQNPSHTYLINTSYLVQLIVQNIHGCKDTAIQNIVIKSSPTTDFNYSLSCENSTTSFTDNSIIPTGTAVSNIYWNFGDNTTSTLYNPSHVYTANVLFNVLHVITLTNGCKDSTRKSILVNPKPNAFFTTGNICLNSLTQFNDLSVILGGTITNWEWKFGNTGASTNQNPQYTFTSIGNSIVKLIVTSGLGCKDSATQTIIVNPLPVAAFTFTPNIGSPPTDVNFTNTSTGAVNYLWDLGDGNQSVLYNPSHTYADTGVYQISLIATNNFGCKDTTFNTFKSVPRKVDVAIVDFTAALQNNYLNITAQLKNKGTVDVTSMDIYVKVNNGPSVKENWSGTLIKNNGTLLYQFPTSMYLNESDHFICISLDKPNDTTDEFFSDNYLCKAIDVSTFQVMDAYPVPTSDMLTLPLVIPEKDILIITLFDARGKELQLVYSGMIEEGLQMIKINTLAFNSGMLVCKIEYKKNTIIKKLLKK